MVCCSPSHFPLVLFFLRPFLTSFAVQKVNSRLNENRKVCQGSGTFRDDRNESLPPEESSTLRSRGGAAGIAQVFLLSFFPELLASFGVLGWADFFASGAGVSDFSFSVSSFFSAFFPASFSEPSAAFVSSPASPSASLASSGFRIFSIFSTRS